MIKAHNYLGSSKKEVNLYFCYFLVTFVWKIQTNRLFKANVISYFLKLNLIDFKAIYVDDETDIV